MIQGTKIKEKKKYFPAPEDFTQFDQKEFRQFSAAEITLLIAVAILLIICIIQAIQFK
jgi:hypothetical protein